MALNLKTRIVSTTPYNIVPNDEVILVNVNGPALINLPTISSSSSSDGKFSFYIKDLSGSAKINPITIKAAGGKLIDNVAFALLNVGYCHIQLVYDGTNWASIA